MIRINLIIGPPSKKSALWPVEQPPIALYAIILLLASFVAIGWWYWSLHSQRTEMLVLKEELSQEVLQLQVVRTELEKHQDLKTKLAERISVIERLKTNQTGPVLLMNGVISSISESPTLWLTSLEQRENLVTIEGRALSLSSVADFIARLDERPLFKQVDLNLLEEDESNVRFKLSCELS